MDSLVDARCLIDTETLQIVTGYLDSAARNLGHTEQPEVRLSSMNYS